MIFNFNNYFRKASLSFLILLSACAGDEKLPGVRESIFNMEEQSQAENAINPVQLSGMVEANDWVVENRNVNHTCDNLIFSNVGELKEDWSANIGSFNKAFEYISTPVVANDVLYALNDEAVLFAFDLKNGKRIYKKSLIDLKDKSIAKIDYYAGLAFDNKENVLYAVIGNGKVFALKPDNADIIWEADLKQPVKAAPNLSDNNLFIATVNNAIVALNKDTGKNNFVVNTVSQMTAFAKGSVPAYHNGIVAVGFSNDEVYFIDETLGNVVYAVSLFGYGSGLAGAPIVDITSNVIIDDDGFVFANNTESSLKAIKLPVKPDFKSETIWSVKNGAYSTLCANGNALFMVNNQNQLTALDKKTGKIIWSFDLKQQYEDNKKIFNTLGIVLANGELIISNSFGDLIFVDAESGKFNKKVNVASKLITAPIVVKDRIIVVASIGDIITYMYK